MLDSKDVKKADKKDKNKHYNNYFFTSISLVSWGLFVLGVVGGILIFMTTGNAFQAIAIMFFLVWMIVFLRYFVWSVYHYNVNYGITSNDWEKIAEARERKRKGEEVEDVEIEEPAYNPFRSQTFGLPTGTVRGMIAFTLLFGSVTILMASMGMTEGQLQNSLIRDQFEFFKTAFLMMIAFYFGDKSLRYLQQRWTKPNTRSKNDETEPNDPPNQPEPNATNDLDKDEEFFIEQDRRFAKREEKEVETGKSQATVVKNTMNQFLTSDKAGANDGILNNIKNEYVQVADNSQSKILNDELLKKALAKLKNEDGIQLQLPVLKAIIEVESGGRGHLSDGRAKILFEGHKFWYWLKKQGKDPELLKEGNETILYPKWTKKFYRGGTNEYFRFDQASLIDKKAAIYSTSWGLFQILGENLEHNIKSRLKIDPNSTDKFLYNDEFDFVKKQNRSEYYHLLDFLAFVKTKVSQGKKLIDYVSGNDESMFDWGSFAYGYNGPGYKENKYDEKLQKAYIKHSGTTTPAENSGTKQRIPIIDAGHGGIDANGNYTTGNAKRYKFTGEDQNGLEIFEGDINRKIAQKLIAKLKAANLPYHDLNSTDASDLSLKERVEIADNLYAQNKYHYYLSIHSNSASTDLEGKGTTAQGFEIYTSPGTTTSDMFAKIAAKTYKQHFPDRAFRGLKEASFYVLKYTDCPAFLVENLFFDNFEEAKFLSSDAGQEAIANCLFEVVRDIT